jgi:prepilin-type N-terminal cleavage/methylation domain-containing protein/prepilin-type processing-associated H-X9-DG protein
MFHRAKSNSLGFTLIELLVVIAIITVLISVMLPSLQKARAQAQSIKCLSIQKQMGVASLYYANDNRGILPFFSSPAPGLGLLPYYRRGSQFWLYFCEANYVQGSSAVQRPQGLECPMITPDMNNSPNFYDGGIAANMNAFFLDDELDSTPPPPFKRVDKIQYPTRLNFFADNVGSLIWHYKQIDYRHGLATWNIGQSNFGDAMGYANVSYADGHAGVAKYEPLHFWNGSNWGTEYAIFYWDRETP